MKEALKQVERINDGLHRFHRAPELSALRHELQALCEAPALRLGAVSMILKIMFLHF